MSPRLVARIGTLAVLLAVFLPAWGCGDDDAGTNSNNTLDGCLDRDGDLHGPLCLAGDDCDDTNPECFEGPCCDVVVECVDLDGDSHGVGCDAGADCNDNKADCFEGSCCDEPCRDPDGDLHGVECAPGPDCNEDDAECFAGYCCEPPAALLEVYQMDIWGQFLPLNEASLAVSADGEVLKGTGDEVTSFVLRGATTLEVALAAPEHDTASIDVVFDGGTGLGSATLTMDSGSDGQGVSFSHEMRTIDSVEVPVHTLYLGLRHKWFSAQGRPARRGNHAELLIGGEEAWQRVYESLNRATDSILISSWWWMSDFELVRDWFTHAELTEEERWANTMMGVLETNPSHIRILVGEFWGSNQLLDWLNIDDTLSSFAETPDDDFEFMGQGNPTSGVFTLEVPGVDFGERVRQTHPESAPRAFDPEDTVPSTIAPTQVDMTDWPFIDAEFQIASWHQKFSVIDHREAFIGGMNVKSTDWDTSRHMVFDHRRMNYDATLAERQAVMDKERDSDLGPRRDYIIRVDGPSAQDAEDVFQKRWSQAIADREALWDVSTEFSVNRDIDPYPDGVQVQVTATMPAPFHEYAIAETWFNAVAQAQEYIFIEDQYWRIPWLVDAIVDRMRQVPELKLLVITKEVDEWLDPGCEWTSRTNAQLLDEFGAERYRTYVLRTFDSVVTFGINETDAHYINLDTHSKMFIVDDKFMSVGSCNKNNRGVMYEGELNAAVLDRDFVTAQRQRIFENLLPIGTQPTDEVNVWWEQFSDAAAHNDAVYERWEASGGSIDNGDGSGALPTEYQPLGFVHGLSFRTVDDCFFEGVGADMTFR